MEVKTEITNLERRVVEAAVRYRQDPCWQIGEASLTELDDAAEALIAARERTEPGGENRLRDFINSLLTN